MSGHVPCGAFECSSGPRDAKIAFVGESWGSQENIQRKPFVGPIGQLFSALLAASGIEREACFLTNALAWHPPSDNLDYAFTSRADASPASLALGPFKPGKYLREELLGELTRLRAELASIKANLVVPLGALATWALTGDSRISSLRGTITSTILDGREQKLLPSYHPGYVRHNWADRVVVIADFVKALRESEFPGIRRPSRLITINPTLGELEAWREKLIRAPLLSVDIETFRGQISCIGFAPSRAEALVVPFIAFTPSPVSYWPSPADELCAWNFVRDVLASPAPKLFQNGLFDLSYLLPLGLRVENCDEDTLLAHHALFPEMMKGLGFLGSLYSSEFAWKLMRRRRGAEQVKRDG